MGAQKVTERITRVMADGRHNIQVLLGAEYGRTGMAQFALTWAGELRVFNLTPAQARARGLLPGGALVFSNPRNEVEARLVPRPIQLKDLRVATPPPLLSNTTISATVVATATGPVPGGRIVVRTAYRVDKGSTTGIQFLDALPKDGLIRFNVGPISRGEGDVKFGPVPLYVDLLVTGVRPEGTIASNLLATLLDVQPDLDAYARSALKILDEIITLLESIRDRPGATKAIDDYKSLSVRNDALLEASQRLGPFTKAQDDEFDRGYGAALDAAGRRLGAEIQRLEQAPYAGPAFFEKVQKAVRPRD